MSEYGKIAFDEYYAAVERFRGSGLLRTKTYEEASEAERYCWDAAGEAVAKKVLLGPHPVVEACDPVVIPTKADRGWGWPAASKKAHYFVGGTSLCGKWMFFGRNLENTNHDSNDNCSQCKTRYQKGYAKADAAQA